ncbi:T9SS type A sorting domain-containing protein, partial [bacterium]|nr:T9SS type A sorting domain-containing protein [bacterium]
SHFQFNKYTHWSYPVIIDTVNFELTPLEPGDEIAVFDGAYCVGAAEFSGSLPIVINCWKDDLATPNTLDGYLAGNEMSFAWFDVSENSESEFVLPPMTSATKAVDYIGTIQGRFGEGIYARGNLMDGCTNISYLPKQFNIKQNYPNPFNSTTVIPLELPQRSRVTIDLFDVCGRLVWTHNAGVKNAGWPKIHFNASNLASGVYFYRVTATGLERGGRYQDVGKMLLLK